MAGPVVDILMYHSVSEGGGPTCIAPAVFAAQIEAIADARVPVITLDDLVDARRGKRELPPHAIVITFDDGFQDFADAAWPVLKRHGFPAIVYLPADYPGRLEGWRGGGVPPRRVMDWQTVQTLAADGVRFGSHTLSHPDLTTLPPAQLDREIAGAKALIEEKLARPVAHFAPPYGQTNAAVRAAVARHHHTSVGTDLGQVHRGSDLLHLPRLEMFYFTDLRAWRRHLAGQGATYLARRRLFRRIGRLVRTPW